MGKQRRVELKSVGNFVPKTVLVESANQFSLEELCRTQYSLKYFFRSHVDHQTYGKTLSVCHGGFHCTVLLKLLGTRRKWKLLVHSGIWIRHHPPTTKQTRYQFRHEISYPQSVKITVFYLCFFYCGQEFCISRWLCVPFTSLCKWNQPWYTPGQYPVLDKGSKCATLFK